MSHFGTIPPEPPAHRDLSECAPLFADAVRRLLAAMESDGFDPIVNEAIRTDERQAWLYGFGRDYDDGRGLVTHAQTARKGWHFFGCAVDIISKAHGWDSSAFFDALQRHAESLGLTSGSAWRMKDRPHVQWGHCRTTPSQEASDLYVVGGLPAVWHAVHADTTQEQAA